MWRRVLVAGAVSVLVAWGVCVARATPWAPAAVLRVGSYQGIPGQYSSIQAAVDAARPGDWLLVGPGDYHEAGNRVPPGVAPISDAAAGAAVLVTTPNIWIRGMDRNRIVLDGTKPGAPQCSSAPGDQNLGPIDSSGLPTGRNGLIVFKANGVCAENLTACNFISGDLTPGDEISFDGGGSSGTQQIGSWRGAYLSATSSYYGGTNQNTQYGIYASNTFGPGLFTQVYANNIGDAGFYVGACPDCNTVLDHAHAQNSAEGYSGTNSGGHLVIQNSEFDHNYVGIVTNSQNNDDQPSPSPATAPASRPVRPVPILAGWSRITQCTTTTIPTRHPTPKSAVSQWESASCSSEDGTTPSMPTTFTTTGPGACCWSPRSTPRPGYRSPTARAASA